MAIISKEGLLKVLVSYNPWWKTGVVNPKLSKTYKRFAFYEAMKRLNQTDILLGIDIFVIALQNLVHGAQLQHGMVHGNKDDLLGRNTALKQGLDHLVLYGGLSNPSGPC